MATQRRQKSEIEHEIEAERPAKPPRGRPKGGVRMDLAPAPERSVVDAAATSIRRAIARLEEVTEEVAEMLAVARAQREAEEVWRESNPGKKRPGKPTKYNDRLSSHLAYLTVNMSKALDAMRKQEAADRKRWEGMSREEELEIVKAWAEDLPVDARRELRQHLEGMETTKGLLG